ncbi:MAG TPA: HAMP domain-containing sensor histidine kinase [Terriglobia bacterium]|nr:HAMP domain-containing sensor histidine kinase [Terriglobia bacterium]
MGIRRQKPPLFLLVVAVLILLLPVLAYLQYDWLGKVSEREREQLQSAIQRTLRQFSKDFDREIARAFIQFQNRGERGNQSLTQIAKLYANWHATAPYPRLIRDVFFEGQDSRGMQRFKRLDPESGIWIPADPPHEFSPPGGLGEPIDTRIPAIMIPLFETAGLSHGSGFEMLRSTGRVILRLDLAYIQKVFVPALVRSDFAGSIPEFRIQIRSSDDAESILYNSDPGAPLQGSVDGEESLLTLRPDEFHNLMPIEFPIIATARSIRPLPDKLFSFHVGAVQTHAGIAAAVIDQGGWKITAVHRAGSLDAAVAQLRRRNLAISFSILAVLATSIGMVLISTARAQRLARQQIEFVSTVSHELRTPLAVICSAGENLADGVVNDREQLETYGKLVRDEGRRLTEMVEQVLSFAGLQSGLRKQTFVPVDLADIVEQTLQDLDMVIHEDGFTVERAFSRDLPPIMADPVSLRRAVHNLITNAIKYSGSERWIRISIVTEEQWVRLTVEDRGVGIASADLSHIFEPFYRCRTAVEAQIHGSGIGLSLVKKAIDQHGGEVSVTSTPGCGSSFSMALPITRPLEASSV